MRGKIGVFTGAIALILVGLMIILHTFADVSYGLFRDFWPILIILFGLEVLYYRIRLGKFKPRFSGAGISLVVVVGAVSALMSAIHPVTRTLAAEGWNVVTQGISSANAGPSFVEPVKGQVSIGGKIKRIVIQVPIASVTVTGTDTDTVSYDGQLPVHASSDKAAKKELQQLWLEQKSGDTLKLIYQAPNNHMSLNFSLKPDQVYLNVKIPQSLVSDITTTDGAVHVTNVAADTTVHTTNGPIELNHVNGNTQATATNGPITVDDVTKQIQAATTNGTISIQSAVGGSWNCRTVNGSIKLSIPSSSSVNVDARTVLGRIAGSSQWSFNGRHHGSFTQQGGRNAITLQTVNGSVTVNQN